MQACDIIARAVVDEAVPIVLLCGRAGPANVEACDVIVRRDLV